MTTAYPLGSTVRHSVAFANAAGTAVDPSTVTVKYRVPGASSATSKVYGTDSEVVKSATGAYYIDLDHTTAGDWRIGWFGTGASNKAAKEGVVKILPGYFA